MSKGKLYGISVGPGDPELITVKAINVLKQCAVIAAPRTKGVNTFALDIASKALDLRKKEIIYLDFPMTSDKKQLDENYFVQAENICKMLANSDVAMLSIGDVSIYSTFSYISKIVHERGFEVVSIPGVPSFCACAAALDSPLVIQNQALHVFSASDDELEKAMTLSGTKIVMKSGKSVNRILELVNSCGLLNKTSVVSNCGIETQEVKRTVDNTNDDFGYFSTIVIKE